METCWTRDQIHAPALTGWFLSTAPSGKSWMSHFFFTFYFILEYTHGEGNGNPLQYSCLENPMDGGTWWAAICGVAQSQTRLKRLSSSSSRLYPINNIVIVSGAQQSNSVIHIHVSILQTPLPSRLPHNIEQSSLCHTVSPCWLSILNIAMCTLSVPNSLAIHSPHPYPQQP